MSNLMDSEGKPTARRGLHGGSKSPLLSGNSPQTRSRTKEGRSPARRNTVDSRDRSDDDHSSDGDIDRVDCAAHKGSPSLYPDINEELGRPGSDSRSSPDWTPNAKRSDRSFDDSYLTARSNCVSRTGPSGQRPVSPKNFPVTPEKGSPGRKIHPSPDHTERNPRKRGIMPILAISFALLIGFCIISLHQSLKNVDDISKPKPKTKSLEEMYKDIKRDLRYLNSQFSQPKHFWIQLIGQLETIMIKNPIQPAVILAVAPEGAEETAVCLLHQISHAVSSSFEGEAFVMYDVKSESRKGPSRMKYDLHEELLRLGQSHAAIVHNIEKLPGNAAMTFHAFCDNENAPFKQALIFLVLSLPMKYEDISESRLANTIDDYLLGLWGEELHQKDVSAVVSRVANAPVLIKPEEPTLLKTACSNL